MKYQIKYKQEMFTNGKDHGFIQYYPGQEKPFVAVNKQDNKAFKTYANALKFMDKYGYKAAK